MAFGHQNGVLSENSRSLERWGGRRYERPTHRSGCLAQPNAILPAGRQGTAP